ncbi:MAG: hypothetical protein LBB24_01100, partial [Rickettsiales bacterium]|nr:hypothetical protein [Rickettsiales bacterium]
MSSNKFGVLRFFVLALSILVIGNAAVFADTEQVPVDQEQWETNELTEEAVASFPANLFINEAKAGTKSFVNDLEDPVDQEQRETNELAEAVASFLTNLFINEAEASTKPFADDLEVPVDQEQRETNEFTKAAASFLADIFINIAEAGARAFANDLEEAFKDGIMKNHIRDHAIMGLAFIFSCVIDQYSSEHFYSLKEIGGKNMAAILSEGGYEGGLKDDRKDGKGKYTLNGDVCESVWENDVRIEKW